MIRTITRQNGRQTQKAAIFAVVSELYKRGYEASLSTTKHVALLAVSPIERKHFRIEVKGLHKPNAWKIKLKPQPETPDLYCVLALVPVDQPNEFFVMTDEQCQRLIREDLKRLGRPDSYPAAGITWNHGEGMYRNAWNLLPK